MWFVWFKLRGIYDASFVSTHCWSSIFCHWSPSERCPWDLLNESQSRMLKKCSTKWDCLVYEMLYIRTIRPNLNTQSDSIRAKLFVWLSMPFNLFISSLYILDFIILLSLDNDVLETSKRRAMFYNILSQIFIVKCFTKSLLIQILLITSLSQNTNSNNFFKV